MQEINHAKNNKEIRYALHNLSQAKGWGNNMTLQQMLKTWEDKKGGSASLQDSFAVFQNEQFSGNSSKSFEDIKVELLNSLKSA